MSELLQRVNQLHEEAVGRVLKEEFHEVDEGSTCLDLVACWERGETLVGALKLCLSIAQEREPETMLYVGEDWEAAAADTIEVEAPEAERDLPDFSDSPRFRPVRLVRTQCSHLEVVCVKSTMMMCSFPSANGMA